ncbi:MAG: diguanylate cyclase [Candidatus Omnitrophica bacterium]|nr:diguanylate cyclase [Candidatus Omnitrophota bacterium]
MNEHGSFSHNFAEEKRAADIDPLTGLFNRYYLDQIFPESLKNAEKNNLELCVFIIDIDDFKHINDTYGHLAGDAVLKSVAEIFNHSVRDDDVVIRYAGDEFIILSKEVGYKLASIIGERIITGINRNIVERKDGEKIHVSISGGFAIYPYDGTLEEELIENADRALYLSKQKGKNRISAVNEVTRGIVAKKEMLRIFPCRKFIGRQAQIAMLKKAWQNSSAAKTPLVFVKGEMGIGKTRIIKEFDKDVSKEGAMCLKVECQPKHIEEPYYSIAQALGKYFKKNEVFFNAVYFLSPQEVEALMYIIPSLRESLKSDPKAFHTGFNAEDKELSINLFKALRNLFIEISRQNGLLLCFDDIQWLDKATFELLNYFIEWESGRKLLICGCLCEDELKNVSSPCLDFLSNPKKTVNLSLIEIPCFSLEQTKELVGNIFSNIDAENNFFESIHSLGQGNPLFIEELLKYLIESETIFYKDKKWQMNVLKNVDIPASLDEIMKRRIKGLDSETKEMLAQAALIGEDFHLETLRGLVEKNEGYLLELIDRAKQKFMIMEADKAKGFNFNSSYLQKAFYNELTFAQKNGLHNKAGKVISELYARNPSAAAGDLLYHYNMADNKAKLKEYNQILTKNSLALFNPRQVDDYIEILSGELAHESGQKVSQPQIKQITAEIDAEALSQIGDLIKLIYNAVKNMGLYPPKNRIREESIKRVYEQLLEMLKSGQSLTFSEVEKILLINGRRIPLKAEKKAVISNFVSSMIELDVKALQFLPSLEETELVEFLNIFAEEPDSIRTRGGVVVLLKEKGINNIKINVADYGQMAMSSVKHPVKERLISMVLTDFLTGKASSANVDKNAVLNLMQSVPEEVAANIVKVAGKASSSAEKAKIITESIGNLGEQILPGGWTDYKNELVKLLKNLNAETRNEVVLIAQDSKDPKMDIIKEVVAKFSDDEIIEMIISGYSHDKTNLLNMRELVNKLIFDDARKNKILTKLEQELRKKGLEESEISFITQKDYKSQALEDRLQGLLNLPAALYPDMGIDNVKKLIEDLASLPKKSDFNKLISQFLRQMQEAAFKDRAVLFDLSMFSLSLFTCDTDEFDELFCKIIEVYTGYVTKENNRDNYKLLLEGVQGIINWVISSTKSAISVKRWVMRKRFSCLNRLLESLFKFAALKAGQEQPPQDKELRNLVANFLQQPSNIEIIDILINELKDSSAEYIEMIEDMIVRFGPKALRVLILSSLEEEKMFDPFESYIYQRKIVNILKKMENIAVEEIISYLSKEYDIKKLLVLIRFAAEFKNDKIIEALKFFLTHQDNNLKEELILALGKIGTQKSKALLTQMKSDKDRKIACLAASEIKKFK